MKYNIIFMNRLISDYPHLFLYHLNSYCRPKFKNWKNNWYLYYSWVFLTFLRSYFYNIIQTFILCYSTLQNLWKIYTISSSIFFKYILIRFILQLPIKVLYFKFYSKNIELYLINTDDLNSKLILIRVTS